MKIILGSDHGGYNLKNIIIAHLEQQGIEVEDLGCYSEDSCDYPVIAKAVAEKVLGPVHQTLQFQLGPVPVMGFSGFGNIDLKVKGNKKDPHTFGQFNTINATIKIIQ